MTLSRAQQDIAVALWAERTHGAGAPVFIAEQIGALALQGDQAGIARWQAIAAAYEQLAAEHPQ